MTWAAQPERMLSKLRLEGQAIAAERRLLGAADGRSVTVKEETLETLASRMVALLRGSESSVGRYRATCHCGSVVEVRMTVLPRLEFEVLGRVAEGVDPWLGKSAKVGSRGVSQAVQRLIRRGFTCKDGTAYAITEAGRAALRGSHR